jgi:hypothetical protein
MSSLSANNTASLFFRTYRGLCSANGKMAEAAAGMREVGVGQDVGAFRNLVMLLVE